MSALVHKSINIRPEVWKKARVNAELSGVALRDYLSYLIQESQPVEAEADALAALEKQVQLNRIASRSASG